MSWKVLKTNPSLLYNEAKKDIDFSNTYYSYFAYNEEDINFMLSSSVQNAVAEQTYFLSFILALINSIGGTNRLVKNIFFKQSSFESYVTLAKSSNISLPEHVKAKATGKSTIQTVIIDGVDEITKVVRDSVDQTTLNLAGFRLSTLVPYLLVIGGVVILFIAYRNLKS